MAELGDGRAATSHGRAHAHAHARAHSTAPGAAVASGSPAAPPVVSSSITPDAPVASHGRARAGKGSDAQDVSRLPSRPHCAVW